MSTPDPTRARLEAALADAERRRDDFKALAERELSMLTYHADQLQALIAELDAPDAPDA